MKAFAIFTAAFSLTAIVCTSRLIREDCHKADAAAVTRVTGYLEGQSAVTLQDLARCESVDPDLVRRALAKINAR